MQLSVRQRVLASLAAIGCFGALAAGAIFGAFSAQSVNASNEFSSATLSLTTSNDAVAEPVYAGENAVPGERGDTEHSCIEVTYTGTVAAEVRLMGRTDSEGSGLASDIVLRVTEGDGGVGDACDGFVQSSSSGNVFGGTTGSSLQTIRTLHSHWAGGLNLGTWQPGEGHVYRFESWLNSSADPVTAQGKDAGSQAFVWEARAGD